MTLFTLALQNCITVHQKTGKTSDLQKNNNNISGTTVIFHILCVRSNFDYIETALNKSTTEEQMWVTVATQINEGAFGTLGWIYYKS